MAAESVKTQDLAIAIRILRHRSWVSDEEIMDGLLCCPRDPEARDLLQILIRRGALPVDRANQILQRIRNLLRTRIGEGTRRRSEDQLLGRMALERGWITLDALESAILEQAQLRKNGLRFRIGEVLVRRAELSGMQVRRLLDEQGRLNRTCADCGLVVIEPGQCTICGQILVLAPALGPYCSDLEFSQDIISSS